MSNALPPPAVASGPPRLEEPRSYRFGRFTLEVRGQRLMRGGELIPLTNRAFDTLVTLIRHRDRIVAKEELLHLVWGDTNVSEASLAHNISLLRHIFEDDATRPRYIETRARRGYQFIADVVESAAPTDAPRQGPGTAAVPIPRPALRRRAVLLAAAMLLATVTGGIIAVRFPGMSADDAAIRVLFSVDPPHGTQLATSGALSPNGRYLAFVGQDTSNNTRRIWIRNIESGEMRALDGTEGAWRAFWSPDSRALGFFADSRIKRVGLQPDDPARVIGTTVGSKPPGGSWGVGDVIVYADDRSLYTIPATGGPARLVRRVESDRNQYALAWPQLLSDGEHFLYSVASMDPDRTGTYFGRLSSRDDVRVVPEPAEGVVYAPPGYLVFVRNGVIMAQPFDGTNGRLRDRAFPLTGRTVSNPVVSASANGILSFGGGTIDEHLTWVDRSGRTLRRLDGIPSMYNLVLSPDGRQVLGDVPGPRNAGSWLVDLERNVATPALVDGARQPYWSPDGTQIAYTTQRGDLRGIYVRPVHGDRADELVLQTGETKLLSDWTRDGRFLVYVSWNEATKQDLWILSMTGARDARPFLRTPARELDARVSPDGRWIAYASDKSGRLEVYVDSLPVPGTTIMISNDGGSQPQWRADGKELFYLAGDGSLMSVEVALGPRLRVGPAERLFHVTLTNYRNIYMPDRNGQRFLIVSSEGGTEREPITLFTNWNTVRRDEFTGRAAALSHVSAFLNQVSPLMFR